MDATKETGGPPRRTEAHPPVADLPARGPPQAETPNAGADQPENQRASVLNMTTSGSDQAPDVGQPCTGPGQPAPDAEHAAGLPPPTAHRAQFAGRADAAPFLAPAHHRDAGAPGNAASGEVPPQGPLGANAKSKARAAIPDMPKRAADREMLPGRHHRDKDSFDAFMESCTSDPRTDPAPAAPRGHQEPRGNHAEGTPLTVSR